MKIAHAIGFILGLLLLSWMYSSHAEEFLEENYTLTCSNKKETPSIPINQIKYMMVGINGAPNCVAGIDLAGKVITICDTEENPVKCVLIKEIGV